MHFHRRLLNKCGYPLSSHPIRAAIFDGEHHWHRHEKEDELFLVYRGTVKIRTKIGDVTLNQGQGVKVFAGIEHCPSALEPSIVLMFEHSRLKSKGD